MAPRGVKGFVGAVTPRKSLPDSSRSLTNGNAVRSMRANLRVFQRGRSSVGRAPQWHCGGQGFNSPRLHQFFLEMCWFHAKFWHGQPVGWGAERSSMPNGINRDYQGGQSIVELVVVLALVGIVTMAVLVGVGQKSGDRLQHVSQAFAGSGNQATSGGPADRAAQPAPSPSPAGADHDSNSSTNTSSMAP